MSHMHDYSIAVSVLNIRIYPTRYLSRCRIQILRSGGGGQSFWPFGAQFGPKKGGPGSPGPLPYIRHCYMQIHCLRELDKRSRCFSFLIILQILKAFSLDDVLILSGEC